MKSIKKVCALILGGLLTLGVGCTSQKPEEKVTLTVSAAASLTDCMEALKKSFNEQYPNIELQFNYGASGTLQKQIEQGAPADIFFSAGMKQMKALEEGGFILDHSVEEIVSNRLALIVPEGGNTDLTFENLTSQNIDKIAVGEVESVPVGQYTVEVFKNLGTLESLEPHFVYAKDVREVLTWVETGNVDAGVVYETDAKISENVVICDLADASLHKAITYPIAIIKNTNYEEEARTFINFIKTEEGKAILEQYGFTPEF